MNKTWWIVIGAVVIAAVIGGLVWTSRDKTPIETAEPITNSAPVPTIETAASSTIGQYNWSTMPQGPYHDKISYATSTDLLSWKDFGITLAEHASVPDVLLRDGTLYLYFVDTTTDGKPEQIGLMKSTDNGTTWSEREFVAIKGEGVANIVPVDPAPFLLPNNQIRIYYFDIAGPKDVSSKSKFKIYSAISTDGLNFTQESGIRYEEEGVLDPDVIKVGDVWRLYVGNPEGQKVISAISTDGLNFTREGVAYEGSSVPNVIYEGGKYYLYTAGIQIATSTDGKTFTKTSSSFTIKGGLTADPGVVKLGSNNYLMVYKTSSQQPQGAPPLGQTAQ